jgi:hypothetical protein
VGLCIHSPIRHHGVVLNELSTGTDLPCFYCVHRQCCLFIILLQTGFLCLKLERNVLQGEFRVGEPVKCFMASCIFIRSVIRTRGTNRDSHMSVSLRHDDTQ